MNYAVASLVALSCLPVMGCVGASKTQDFGADTDPDIQPPLMCDTIPDPQPWDGHPIFGHRTTTAAPSMDAGLADLVAAIPSGASLEGDWPVVGALVINVGHVPALRVWLVDGHDSVALDLASPVSPPPSPGDLVSFHATKVAGHQGDSRVLSVVAWSIDGSGEPVPVVDAQRRALQPADVGKNVVIYGDIDLFHDNGTVCAPEDFLCNDVMHDGQRTPVVMMPDEVLGTPPECTQYLMPAVTRRSMGQEFVALELGNDAWYRVFNEDP